MAKKGTKIALTYVITILATFLIIGGIFVYLMHDFLEPDYADNSVTVAPVAGMEEFVPSDEYSRTTLFILDSKKKMSGCCFMAARLSVASRQLIIMPIPADTRATVDGTTDSIYNFYRNGGTAKAVSAVGSAVGIKIDYYVKMNDESFTSFAGIFGGTDYNIPYNLIYTDPDTGEETVFREGETYLEAYDMIRLFTFPAYNSGEEYRAKVTGIIISDLLNYNIHSDFAGNIDEYFNMVINSPIETNYTAYDFSEQSDAIKYVAGSDETIVKLVTVSGTYDENSLFVLDEDFVQAVPAWLKLSEE